MKRALLLGGGIVSSAVYIAVDLIASRRYAGYTWRDFSYSELLSPGSPVRRFVIVASVIPYDLLVLGLAAGVWQTTSHRRDAHRTGAALAGYAIIGSLGGIVFPAARRGDEIPFRNAMHIPATAAMSVSLLLGMVFGARLLGPRFRRYSHGTIAVLLVFGGLTGARGGDIAANRATPWLGVEERVNIYATMLWLAALGLGLLLAEHGAAEGREGPAAPGAIPSAAR